MGTASDRVFTWTELWVLVFAAGLLAGFMYVEGGLESVEPSEPVAALTTAASSYASQVLLSCAAQAPPQPPPLQ